MTISNPDAALLRSNRHAIDLVVNATPKVVVATAVLTDATFSFPLGALGVGSTTGWSNVRVGQMVWIGTTAGAYDVAIGVVRKAPLSNTLYIDAKARGDSGKPRDIRIDLATGQHVTILKVRPPWSLYSRIASGIFYKQFDLAYSDQGSSPAPVPLLGEHRQAFVGSGGYADLEFTASAITWGTKTLSSVLWSVDGGTVTVGTLTSTTLTVRFTPGWYVVECTVTDSGGKSTTGWRYVWVNDTGASAVFPAWSGQHTLSGIENDREDRAGRSMSLTVTGELDGDALFPEMAFLVSEYAYYNGSVLSDESVRVSSYFGYLSDFETTQQIHVGRTEIALLSPMGKAMKLGAATQLMTEVTSPNEWTQVTSALSHPPGAIWYILAHHAPSLIAAHDVEFDAVLKTYRKASFSPQGGTLGEQLRDIAKLIPGGNIGSRSNGSWVLARSSVYLTNSERNALDVKFTWGAGDIAEEMVYPRAKEMTAGRVRGLALAFDGGEPRPYASRAPGLSTSAQGGGTVQHSWIVPPSNAVDEQLQLNVWTGHAFAELTPETDNFTFTADRNVDIAEPAQLDVWHEISVDETYDPVSVGYSGRAVPLRVRREWELAESQLIKQIRIDWQRETFGLRGETEPIESGGGNNWLTDGWNLQIDIPYQPHQSASNMLLAFNSAGALGRAFNVFESPTTWESISSGISGSACGVAFDMGSPLPASNYEDIYAQFGAWAIATSGTSLRVYYTQDILADSPVWVLQHTYTMADSGPGLSPRIVSHKTDSRAAVVWHDQAGTKVGRFDGSWQTAVSVGATATDTTSDGKPLAVGLDGDTLIVSAMSANNTWRLYRGGLSSGSFTQVTDSPSSTHPYQVAVPDGLGRVYTAYDNNIGAVNRTFTEDFTGAAIANRLVTDVIVATPSSGVNLGCDGDGIGAGFNSSAATGDYAIESIIRSDFGASTNTQTWHVTEVTAQLSVKSWNYTALASFEIEFGFILRDEDGDALYTFTDTATVSRGSSAALVCNSVSINETGLDVDDVLRIEWFARTTTDVTKGASNQECWLVWETLSAEADTVASVRLVLRVASYTGSAIWTDITPRDGYTTESAFGLARDPRQPANVAVIAFSRDLATARFYASVNRGSNWSGGTIVSYEGLALGDGVIFLFGLGALNYQFGDVVDSALGNWATAIGAVGTIRGIAGLL